MIQKQSIFTYFSKVLIILLFLVSFSSINVYSDETFTLKRSSKSDSIGKEFLKIFTDEEQNTILAFEADLDIFATIYSYHNKDMVNIPSDIELFDIGVEYLSFGKGPLDKFLEYICTPFLNKTSNMESNVVYFKLKIKRNYEMVKQQRVYREKRKDFLEFLFKCYEEIINTPEGQLYFNQLKLKWENL